MSLSAAEMGSGPTLQTVTTSQWLVLVGSILQFLGALVVVWGLRASLRQANREAPIHINTPEEDWRGDDPRIRTLEAGQRTLWTKDQDGNVRQLVGFAFFSIGIALVTASVFS